MTQEKTPKKQDKTRGCLFMLIATTGIILSIFLVGYYVMIEQDTQLQEWMDEHPNQIPDVGGPPRLDLMALVIIPTAIVIMILLKLVEYKEKKNNVV